MNTSYEHMSIESNKKTKTIKSLGMEKAQEKILAECLEFEKQTMKAHKNTSLFCKILFKVLRSFKLYCIPVLLQGQDNALQNLC